MPRELPILNQISIPGPCRASWETMSGDEQRRHCSQCEKSVFHLSEMTRDEAERTVRENEGNLCVRMLVSKSDGHVLTRDDVKATKLPRWKRALRRALGAVLAIPLLCFVPGCSRENLPDRVADWFLPAEEELVETNPVMGDVVITEEMGEVAIMGKVGPSVDESGGAVVVE